MNRARHPHKKPTRQYVGECVSYDPCAGLFVWKIRPDHHFVSVAAAKTWNANFSNLSAGSVVEGRLVLCIDSHKYPATHVAWLLTNGSWPEEVVDHINGNPLDNRIDNLRAVTEAVNAKNSRLYASNKSGAVGVYLNKRWGRWNAQIRVDGRSIYLGAFTDFAQAVAARKTAEEKYGFHPNHGRVAA